MHIPLEYEFFVQCMIRLGNFLIHFKRLCWNTFSSLDIAHVDGHISQAYVTIGCTMLLKRRNLVLGFTGLQVQILCILRNNPDALFILNRTQFSIDEWFLRTLLDLVLNFLSALSYNCHNVGQTHNRGLGEILCQWSFSSNIHMRCWSLSQLSWPFLFNFRSKVKKKRENP